MSSGYRFKLYQDSSDEWRWRFLAPNNKSIAISGEGYQNKSGCEDAIDLVKDHAPSAPVEEE